MILVADSGSTKTTWCIIKDNANKLYFNTEGYNPYFLKSHEIKESLSKSVPDYLEANEIEALYFYGAGCSTEKNLQVIVDGLQPIFRNAKIEVKHDLLCAARASLKKTPGFAAILGTGTNTGLYDGEEITKNVDSLGFYLGDEGSGAYIGKKILREYLRGCMPKKIEKVFHEAYNLTHNEILQTVYDSPIRNRFCAKFAKFCSEHYHVDSEYFDEVLIQCFQDFFDNIVTQYANYQNFTFNCIGSVGYTFKNQLSIVANKANMRIGRILRSPIDDIVEYHINY